MIRKLLAVFGVLLVLILIAGGVGLWMVDGKYGVVFAAPRVDHLELSGREPAIRMVIDPAQATEQVRGVLNEMAPREIPAWAINAFLPHEISLIVEADTDAGQVHVDVLINERRLGPFMTGSLNTANATERFPQITWEEEGFILPRRGAITLAGEVPMDPDAKEEAWLQWGNALVQQPPPLEGGHFIELVADNREGAAWLAGASLMKAWDYDLEEHAKEVVDGVSLASFQFLTEIRATLDLIGEDAARLRLTMDVIPEHRNKLAVINVKVFLEDIFANLSNNFDAYHGIPFKGESRWDDTTLVFEYELGSLRETLELIVKGNLFAGEPPAATSASGPAGRD